jgi:hypothetical protein
MFGFLMCAGAVAQPQAEAKGKAQGTAADPAAKRAEEVPSAPGVSEAEGESGASKPAEAQPGGEP